MNVTEQVIEELIAASFANNADIRQKYFLRESLHNLVRLAKAEQLQEMKMDLARVISPVSNKSSLVAPQ